MTPQTTERPGRNEPCYCGSGRKYKHCCLAKDEVKASKARTKAASVEAAEAPADAAPAAAARTPKPKTHEPWRATTARGFIPKSRTPRKVGGG
jgi:hypothetical protein